MQKLFVVIVLLFFFFTVSAQTTNCDSLAKIYGYGKADTTIILENGIELTFNRCEFFEIRDCIAYKEIKTVKDLQESGLSMLDNEGNILLTCGMFTISFNSGDGCTDKCLRVPAKVKLPIRTNPCVPSIGVNRIYDVSKGVWTPIKGQVTESKNAAGQKFFEFYITCSSGINCDQKLSAVSVKFKAKGIRKLMSMNVSSNCPLLNLNFTTGKRKNIIYAKLPCLNPDSLFLKITGEDRNGNSMNLNKRLSELKPKYTKTDCPPISNKIVKNILGIFKFNQRNVYKKYLIN